MSEGRQKYLYICQNCKSVVSVETKYSMPNDIQCPCGLRMVSMSSRKYAYGEES